MKACIKDRELAKVLYVHYSLSVGDFSAYTGAINQTLNEISFCMATLRLSH